MDGTLIDPGTGLVGRDAELDRLTGCLGPGEHALLLTGGRGIGKSRLLAVAAQRARDAGRHRVVTVDVPPGPPLDAPQLIRRLLMALRHDLPGPVDPGRADKATLCRVVKLIGPPLLVAVDDVHRVTAEAAEVLAEMAGTVPALLLAGVRHRVPRVLRALPAVELLPLDPQDAVRLLEAQPNPPAGRRRAVVLHRAAGNPAAVVELSAGDRGEGRLRSAFAAEIAELPEPVRRLLLHLAAATPPAVRQDVTDAAGLRGERWWEPAERAGLVVLGGDTADFVHPLAADAAYASAPAHQRRQAHRNLARTLRAGAERRALHLAAATSGPDERIAAGLEAAARAFREREDLFEAAQAMEQAAERSPDPVSAARRYAQAAMDARNLGETGWPGELYSIVRRLTTDPEVVITAGHAAATALTRAGRQHEAYAMVTAAHRAGVPADPRVASAIAGLASVIATTSGDEEHRRGLAEMLAAAGPAADPATAAFVRMVIDPAAHPARALCDTTAVPPPGVPLPAPERHRLNVIGTMAGYEDRSRLAVGLLRATMAVEANPRASMSGLEMIPHLVGALIDVGEWDAASRCAEAVGPGGLPVFAAHVDALRAQLFALRGEAAQAQQLVRQALTRVDIQQHRSVHIRLLRAAGVAATIDGDYETAYRYLRTMFDQDGRPRHALLAGRHIAELAAAAVRSGHRDAARVVAGHVRESAGAEPSTRMRLLLHLAEALLSDGERAEQHFRLAATDPAGDEWPYERAMARLHYGEWLRRARRPRDARPVLAAAEKTFTALGAAHAAGLAARELRASGRHDGLAGSSRLAVLTPQERQVAELAARGLRNREIAEQLFISVRTVGAHLHSVYPKLGISGRHQLRDSFPRD
ncbi:transcriptional regulator [Paractinoplanes deccanensis]|uniref:Transcriptional regulator n=1 Tax=Paractinoplanes deccanensis TaxID=113561 RepID=A0ABQ3YHE5_9ACTN|nr:LuxR family transcriptional regulator [Actinoplanes deccanensis]GID79418.1 transcriptional regulator [Actinoplanes deccanensis]